MADKKTIVHIIYNLTRGGAESMLVQVIKKLPHYYNIVVTLEENNHFKTELECDEYICLNTASLFSLPLAAIKIRNIITKRKVHLVHSHLPLSNFAARLGVPANVPLFSTIHNSIAISGDYKKWIIRFLDKATYKLRRSTIIAVSSNAMQDYFSVLKLEKRDAHVLYNFVDITKYPLSIISTASKNGRAICIAALSRQKNIGLLIKGFHLLNPPVLHLDVYGRGQLHDELTDMIKNNGVENVHLKGQVNNIPSLLPAYNIFVMSSRFEGFSLSVLEAMAAGVPVLLSDIPSFREQCGDYALYFDLENPQSLANKILLLHQNPSLLKNMAEKGRLFVED
ncbi:MAG: glycosyltransferase, partial [Sphingobacteriales bacterium]